MKIALWNLEPKIENTALMQISQYHKLRSDEVEWYSPLFYEEYEKIYVSSLFTFTRKPMIREKMIVGGTGFNVCSKLPLEIELCNLDYSLYPKCQTSYLWFSRGCFRQCPFCVVPTKEGNIHAVQPHNLNPKGKYVSIMDNSPTANPKFDFMLNTLESIWQPVDFQCGFDIRLPHQEKWKQIANRLKFHNRVYTAWDNPKEDLTKHLQAFSEVFGKSKVMVYVLIGYWSTQEEDLQRVQKIRELGLDAWVMPYNKRDPYQKAFERWNNRHANCEWKDYNRKEFEENQCRLLDVPTPQQKQKQEEEKK